MKEIRVEDAVGSVLCHDITRIVKGESKGPVFQKGHIVREEDIPVLLSVGKEHLFVWEKEEGMLHENEAAEILYNLCAGEGFVGSEIREGKKELIADAEGLLKIRRDALCAVNGIGEMMIASRHGDTVVHRGDKIAGTRVIPLVIHESRLEEAKRAVGEEPIFRIAPFHRKKVGIVATGSEIRKGLIEDTFTPVLCEKLAEFPTEVLGRVTPGDDKAAITAAILDFVGQGADMVLCTGGMSVDPDDRTPGAISDTGARVVTYGAPVLPGAMMMVAYLERDGGTIPIAGLPGCVMYAKRTIFDLLLPRFLADDEIFADEIARMGEGGLCLNCEVCTFPNCGFGK